MVDISMNNCFHFFRSRGLEPGLISPVSLRHQIISLWQCTIFLFWVFASEDVRAKSRVTVSVNIHLISQSGSKLNSHSNSAIDVKTGRRTPAVLPEMESYCYDEGDEERGGREGQTTRKGERHIYLLI